MQNNFNLRSLWLMTFKQYFLELKQRKIVVPLRSAQRWKKLLVIWRRTNYGPKMIRLLSSHVQINLMMPVSKIWKNFLIRKCTSLTQITQPENWWLNILLNRKLVIHLTTSHMRRLPMSLKDSLQEVLELQLIKFSLQWGFKD